MLRKLLIALLLLASAEALPAQTTGDDAPPPPAPFAPVVRALKGPPPVEVTPPRIAVRGISAKVSLRLRAGEGPALPAGGGLRVEVRTATGELLAETVLHEDEPVEVELILPAGGSHELAVHAPLGYEGTVPFRLRAIAGWVTLVPPFLAILLALAFRQVVPALFAGVWVGAWIIHDGFLVGFLRSLDGYAIGALATTEHITIIVFSLLLGGMVGILSRAGGTAGLVEAISHRATDTRSGQVFSWLMGLLIFFDDYANTLLVGNTMRPVTDRLRISREKLAYIVDSTAAPVASVALISTWIGFEVSLISDALKDVGSTEDAYWVFLNSIPYCFYPALALAFVFLVAVTDRDFGPMLTAERRAAAGKVIADRAQPLGDFNETALAPSPGQPLRWWNALIPIGVVLVVTFVSQYLLGKASMAGSGDPLAGVPFWRLGLRGFGQVFSDGDSFRSLLYGAACGCVVAIALPLAQRLFSVADGLRAWLEGMKSMFLAYIILTLAWSIGDVCRDLGTADFLVSVLSGALDPRLLPLLVFFFSAVVAFSTGTSWTTMSILIPLSVPSAFGVAQAAGMDMHALHGILLATVAAVLGGAIFGDHCSPISDTTVLSSMASGCDHVDHVRTQLPYAMTAAGVAMLTGSLPSGFGLSPWISLVLGVIVLWAIIRFLGRHVHEVPGA